MYGEGKWLYSFHATDPASRTLCNSFDLVRIHKFGHLDDDYMDAKGATRPSYKEMEKFAKQDNKVIQEFEQGKLEKAQKEFKENPEKGLAPLFFDDKKFLIERFCKYFIENEHVGIINGELHIYNNGIYTADEKIIHRRMLKLVPGMLESKRNECVKYIRLLAMDFEVKDNTDYIAFKNGIYNLQTKKLEEARPEIVVTNLIPHNFNESAYSELVDDTLNKLCCGDRGLRELLEEMIGYTFYRSCKFKSAFFLYGPKANNGKSTFLELLSNVLGEENYTALGLENLKDRFKTAELAGKLANIGDDIDSSFIPDISMFKKLSDGDATVAERKGKDPFTFKSYATLIFSANKLPRANDKSNGLLTRMIIIPFNAVFKKTDDGFNRFISRDLKEEECLEYTILLGLKGLLRLLDNGGVFTIPEVVEDTKEEYKTYNNTLLQFLKEKSEEESYDIEKYTPSEVYNQFKLWCDTNGFDKAMNVTSFGIEMKQLGYERKKYRDGNILKWKYIKMT